MRTLLFLALAALFALPASAQNGTVVDVAVASPDHTTLVAAVQAAGLVEALSAEGPFTVFAPANAAFSALPEGTVEALLQPANQATLRSVLAYHVVPGMVDAATLTRLIEDGGGEAVVATLQGGTLRATVEDGRVVLTDAQGNRATVTAADLTASNGVIHVVDTVLMP
ncbi:MAG: fasciclin domain-containing protein [Rubricoccaceae bacterium]